MDIIEGFEPKRELVSPFKKLKGSEKKICCLTRQFISDAILPPLVEPFEYKGDIYEL